MICTLSSTHWQQASKLTIPYWACYNSMDRVTTSSSWDAVWMCKVQRVDFLWRIALYKNYPLGIHVGMDCNHICHGCSKVIDLQTVISAYLSLDPEGRRDTTNDLAASCLKLCPSSKALCDWKVQYKLLDPPKKNICDGFFTIFLYICLYWRLIALPITQGRLRALDSR